MSTGVKHEGLAAAVECGGEYLSVALASYRVDDDGLAVQPIDCFSEHRGHRHADVVLGELARMLKKHDLSASDIRLVAAGRGPGGFTGVRVGLATAQGLAMGWSIPFWGVCSLELLALNGVSSHGYVAPMIDARRGQIYAALYRTEEGGTRTCLSAPEVNDPKDVLARYMEISQGVEPEFVGSGATAYGFATDLEGARHRPYAERTLALALSEWHLAGLPSDGMSVDPIYLRPSDAEIDYERRQAKERGGV